MSGFSAKPRARREQLVVQELQNEVVLYDLDNDQASCLNGTAALVWKYADGETCVEDIASHMAQDLMTPVDARVVWFAIDQLGKKNLLSSPIPMPLEYARMSRRDFMLKAGALGAIVAAPVIISLAAPRPALAASCVANGGPCPNPPGGTGCCTPSCNGSGLCGP